MKKGSFMYPKCPRILVIGDIHGDFYRLLHIMINDLKVFDKDLRWIAEPKNTMIVQMGDQIDYCRSDCNVKKKSDKSDDISVLKLMTKLDMIASKNGGRVLSLLGNHELMNVEGNFDFVSPNSNYVTLYKSWTGENDKIIPRNEAFKQGGILSTFLAQTRHSCVVIGSWIFVHGGVHKDSEDFETIDKTIRKWLSGKTVDPDLLENVLNNPETSIFWNRNLGTIAENLDRDDAICQKNVEPLLDLYPNKRIVVGHTIQDKGITSTCGSRV